MVASRAERSDLPLASNNYIEEQREKIRAINKDIMKARVSVPERHLQLLITRRRAAETCVLL
jgi:hypothetical protein